MESKKQAKTNKRVGGKLVKIVIKDEGKVLMELLPTKQNEVKARRMSYMVGIEVVRVYSE